MEHLHDTSGGVPFLFFINGNFNFVSGHGSRYKDDFAIHTPNTGRPVGQTVDGHNMSARRK
jgi:hypothetical protein